MPYHIVKDGARFCVEKADGSKRIACHDTKAEAEKQMAALYANEPKAAVRHLRLVGATGAIRTAMFDNREHLVVPVVAMIEGVVWAVNSDVPEFVPAEELAETPQQWNGRGCFAGHPKDGDAQVTANTPRTLEQSFGVIFETASARDILTSRRLTFTAWLDPKKAEAVGPDAVDVIRRLREYQENPTLHKPVEVSIGCFVEAEAKDGNYNGKKYHNIWRNIVSDHVAFLAEGDTGACSAAAGCGARTAVRHLVTAQGIERDSEELRDARTITQEERDKIPAEDFAGPHRSFFIVIPEDVNNAAQSIGRADNPDAVKAKIITIAYRKGPKFIAQLPEDWKKPDRHAAAASPQPRAASCGCKGDTPMSEKTTRAELIAALVTDKFSGFQDGDEAILEAASDARLDEFRSASNARKTSLDQYTKLETEHRNVSARLKVAEERLKATEQPLTEEEFIAKAPASIKSLIESFKAEEDALRSSLVSQLKDLGAHTEEQLKKKSIEELKTLAAYARVDVPDFSAARLSPGARNASANDNDDFNPPDPYAAGLKAMQSKAVN